MQLKQYVSGAIVVGCGRMGARHVKVLCDLSIKIVALVDTNFSNIKLILESLDQEIQPESYTNFSEALKNHSPDLVVISTTSDTHYSFAASVIELNIPLLFLEKPLATSIDSCYKLMEAENNSKTRVAVNHSMRFLPNWLIPKDLLSSEKYGGFTSLTVNAGNFGMAMNSTHILEGFRLLSCELPYKISAWLQDQNEVNPRGKNFKDVSGCLRVTTKSGKRLYIDASADQGQGSQFTFMAKYGRITIDELEGRMITSIRKPENRKLACSQFATLSDVEDKNIPPCETIESTKKVLLSLINNEDYPNLKDAASAVKTLIAGYKSSRQGGLEINIESISNDDKEEFPWP